ncbi:MAG: hypothetical protein WCH43_03050 [Verrucomicrobiota bacterium]
MEGPEELVAGLLRAVANKDQAEINRYYAAILKNGAACIAQLRASLVKENDADAAKTLVYTLTNISSQESYAATLEATTLAENKETKYLILDLLKDALNEENSRYLIQLALTGKGDVPAAAADLIASSGKPDLIAGLVNRASTQEEINIAANVLRHSFSASSAQVLQECTMLPNDLLGKAAVEGLSAQSSEESVKLLLNSFNDFAPVPNPDRFQVVVDGLRTMLQQNTDKPGLEITIETLMTTSDSDLTRAAAVAALSSDPTANKEAVSQALEKALKYENDQQVRAFIQQGIRRIHQGK